MKNVTSTWTRARLSGKPDVNLRVSAEVVRGLKLGRNVVEFAWEVLLSDDEGRPQQLVLTVERTRRARGGF